MGLEVSMLYPVYIHKDADGAYGISFPDFPGCFSAADDISNIPRMIQEAVEVHFEGENFDIPAPSKPEQWMDDERYQGGYWLLAEINLSRLSKQPTRLNISLPEYLVRQIDDYVVAHRTTRSGFLAQAAVQAMKRA